MTSPALRHAIAAVVSSLVLLSFCAVPAAAQPCRTAEPVRADPGLLPQVWLWLNEVFGHGGSPDRMQRESAQGLAVLGTDDDASGGPLPTRGGTFDPNG